MEKINAEVFHEVLKTGSFKAAAEKLGYTQAGVSYVINVMESELGIKLFHREHEGVKLTAEGEYLRYYFEQIYAYERLLNAKADEIKSLDTGSVSVRCFSSVAIHWLPGIIENFHKKYPNIQIEIKSTDNDNEVEKLIAEQEVDCGFFALPFHGELDTIILHESPMMVALSSQHPMADQTSFPMEELKNYPFIRMSYDDKDHYLKEIFDQIGGVPKASYVIDHDYAALAMAEKNMGYCLFPKMTLQDIPFRLKCIELYPRVTMKVCIGVKSLKNCSRATREFIRCAENWVKRYFR